MKKLAFLLLILSLNTLAFAQKNYTIDEIPNPKVAGQDYFVSNPDGILSNIDTLNRLITKIEKETKVEIAIVVVRDFNQNEEDFEFAKELFNKWGIGKAKANNGLLLFIATDRRKYRFISGSGVEGLLPDVILKQTGENFLVPAFKEERYDDGILAAINSIAELLTNPTSKAELQGLIAQTKQENNQWKFTLLYSALIILLFYVIFKIIGKQAAKLNFINKSNKNGYDSFVAKGCLIIFLILFASIFILAFTDSFGLFKNFRLTDVPTVLYVILAIALFFRYITYIGILRKLHNDDKNFFDSVKAFNQRNWWMIFFSPIILIVLLIQTIKRTSTTERFSPIKDSKKRQMVRLDRDLNIEGKPFLTKGQREEEIVKAYDYDIWEDMDHTEHIIKAWPAEEYHSFTECPSCGFRTFSKAKLDTVVPATYSSKGEAREIKDCSNCKYEEFIKMVTLAMLVKSSSSSSSSSGGSSSSSSSSGSFGGGSSSGGGAGGSW